MVHENSIELKHKRYLIGIIIAAAIGFGLSAELLRIHYSAIANPDFDAACHISETVDCVSIATTRYAVFFGIPNALLGLLIYLLLAGLAWLQIRPVHPIFQHGRNAIFLIAVWDAAYSVYLALISSLVLKTLCPYCTGLYVVNLAILVLSGLTLDPWREVAQQVQEDTKLILQNRLLFLVFLVLVLAGAGGGAVQYYRLKAQRDQLIRVAFGQTPINLDLRGDPAIGPDSAPVTIVEFTDYQCPHCKNMDKVINKILARYQGRIRLIVKHFPLNKDCNPALKTQLHAEACMAAMAAECADQLGHYPEYKEKLFNAEDLTWPRLAKMAEEVGISETALVDCLKSGYGAQQVRRDVLDGMALEMESTPAFLVNGHLFYGYKSYDDFQAIVDAALHGAALPADQ